MKLKEYIKKNHGTQKRLAERLKINPQQVNFWVKRGDIVFEGALYSKRRELK